MPNNTVNKTAAARETSVYSEINRVINWAIASINDDLEILALLRKGVGTSLDEISLSPRVARFVYATTYSQDPESQNYKITKIERAIYTALTTYAAVSGHRGSEAHNPGNRDTLGRIIGRLYTGENGEKALRNRFERLVTCDEFESVSRYIGDFTAFLKKTNAIMDYGKFAYDLYLLQTDENHYGVLNRWGRGFETSISEKKKKEEKEGNRA